MDFKNIKLLITGGITRKFGNLLGAGHGSKFAELARLNWGNKTIDTLIKHKTPKRYCADRVPSIYFTSATLLGDLLYLCSTTQVLIYRYPSLELIKEINHPYFNDIHHVTKIRDTIYVASTGIDAVLGFNEKGDLIEAKNTLGKNLWFRRSPNIDYRKIASTKPHDSHPNFVFNIDEDIWVTRFEQKDAVNLNNFNERIEINIERPHDGHAVGEYIYFTTVNGCIVIANKENRKIEEIIDLNKIERRNKPLGWCRGFAVIDDFAFVGFSKLRTTKLEKNLRWLKSMAVNRNPFEEALPARIALYNLKDKEIIDEFLIPEKNMSILFSIIPVSQ